MESTTVRRVVICFGLAFITIGALAVDRSERAAEEARTWYLSDYALMFGDLRATDPQNIATFYTDEFWEFLPGTETSGPGVRFRDPEKP